MSFKSLHIMTQAPGCNYYRCVNFAKQMEGAEIWPKVWKDKLPNWEDALMKKGVRGNPLCLEIAKQVAKSDIVVIQRVFSFAGLAIMDYIKKELHKKILVEIDDNILAVDSSNPAYGNVNPGSDHQRRFEEQLSEADGIITSTEYLKKLYKGYCKKIFVVKNSIDFGIWDRLKTPRGHSKVRIGWEGASHHGEDLEIILPVIPKILKKYGDKVEFHFFGHIPDQLRNCSVFTNMVSIDQYPAVYKKLDFDIVLAPLQDTAFNRSKSNIRILEAGALKKAIVASSNKNLAYAQTIKGGETGLLANSTGNWIGAISRLIEDADLREKLGKNLYRLVKDNYNIKNEAKRYEKILRSF